MTPAPPCITIAHFPGGACVTRGLAFPSWAIPALLAIPKPTLHTTRCVQFITVLSLKARVSNLSSEKCLRRETNPQALQYGHASSRFHAELGPARLSRASGPGGSRSGRPY